jgi:hypothetical protein
LHIVLLKLQSYVGAGQDQGQDQGGAIRQLALECGILHHAPVFLVFASEQNKTKQNKAETTMGCAW